MAFTIEHNLDDVLVRLDAIAAAITTNAATELPRMAGIVAERGVAVIKRFTPIGPVPDDILNYEHLADTTGYELAFPDPMSGVIEFVQTKHVPMSRASGGDYPLWQLLTDGHEAPASPIVPVNKQALHWLGADHPVASSKGGAAAPIPYIEHAFIEFLPDVAGVMGNSGRAILHDAVVEGNA